MQAKALMSLSRLRLSVTNSSNSLGRSSNDILVWLGNKVLPLPEQRGFKRRFLILSMLPLCRVTTGLMSYPLLNYVEGLGTGTWTVVGRHRKISRSRSCGVFETLKSGTWRQSNNGARPQRVLQDAEIYLVSMDQNHPDMGPSYARDIQHSSHSKTSAIAATEPNRPAMMTLSQL